MCRDAPRAFYRAFAASFIPAADRMRANEDCARPH
jgi:hypothetical protein